MGSPYKTLATILSINLVIMFLLTYILLDSPAHFHVNLNRIYMAVLMVMPMGLMMLFFMGPMFADKKRNRVLYVLFAVLFAGVFYFARTQFAVGDKVFLQSMIPHHSGAILMCERAPISDPEIERLCRKIIESQREEIAQMETILRRY